jgi:hypothetical protein
MSAAQYTRSPTHLAGFDVDRFGRALQRMFARRAGRLTASEHWAASGSGEALERTGQVRAQRVRDMGTASASTAGLMNGGPM